MKTGPGHEIEPVCEPGTEKEAMREVLRWCLWGMPLLAVAIGVVLLGVFPRLKPCGTSCSTQGWN